MKGIAASIAAVILIMAVMLTAIGVWAGITYLALYPAVPALVFNGEFGSTAGMTAADLDGPWSTNFNVSHACNVTNDVLGDSGYVGCVFQSDPGLQTNSNNSEYTFCLAFEIDKGPVQAMNIDGELQNTGTLQAKDDVVIKEVSVWTNEDNPRQMADLTSRLEDAGTSIDAATGVLPADDYVLNIVFKTKALLPVAVAGDDIFRAKLELTTTGDADTGYITAESG